MNKKQLKSIAALLIAAALTGCSGNAKSQAENATTEEASVDEVQVAEDNEAMIKERVAQIYADLYEPDREQKYCSANYLKVYNAVIAADAELDEIGFFDSNHWTSAQDGPDAPVFKIKNIMMAGPDEAIVTVREDEMDTGATLKMIRERDNWYIDDFIMPETNASEKEQMQEYLNALPN